MQMNTIQVGPNARTRKNSINVNRQIIQVVNDLKPEKGPKLLVLGELLATPKAADVEDSVDTVTTSTDKSRDGELMDVLLLVKTAGTAIIKHLFSLVLYEAAAELMIQVRKHFQDLPFTVGSRLLKIGVKKEDLPPDSQKVKSNEGTELEADADVEGSEGGRNKIRQKSYPPLVEYIPTPSCPFITFEERELPTILWAFTRARPNPAAKSAEKIMIKKTAQELVKNHHGELIRILFHGDTEAIRTSRKVRQTSFGKRTITMQELASSHPDVFGAVSWREYLDEKFKFLKAKDNNCFQRQPQSTTAIRSQ
ncbi:hypothetical protein BG004_004286 [Podila humilis]|nr:hypothetical protein BG004_004286 [Podila humilis]